MGKSEAYRLAGVDLDKGAALKGIIKRLALDTHTADVVSDIDGFGGIIRPYPDADYYFVASADGVGTKVRLAAMLGQHEGLGHDLVNHCVNDILTTGARPLFFVDYVGLPSYADDGGRFAQLARGLADACQRARCSLIGGETAAMGGVYREPDYELVGFIVGMVQSSEILRPQATIRSGDVILGLPSAGLHTNGFSMVRRVFDLDNSDAALAQVVPDTDVTLGAALLTPHRLYSDELLPLIKDIKGIAHITGGGIYENIPRILPPNLAAQLNYSSWTVPPLFRYIQRAGDLSETEMFHIFNMGIGIVVITAPERAEQIQRACPEAWLLGSITERDSDAVVLQF